MIRFCLALFCVTWAAALGKRGLEAAGGATGAAGRTGTPGADTEGTGAIEGIPGRGTWGGIPAKHTSISHVNLHFTNPALFLLHYSYECEL